MADWSARRSDRRHGNCRSFSSLLPVSLICSLGYISCMQPMLNYSHLTNAEASSSSAAGYDSLAGSLCARGVCAGLAGHRLSVTVGALARRRGRVAVAHKASCSSDVTAADTVASSDGIAGRANRCLTCTGGAGAIGCRGCSGRQGCNEAGCSCEESGGKDESHGDYENCLSKW